MRRSASASAFGSTGPGGTVAAPRTAAEAADGLETQHFDWAIVGWYALLLLHSVRRQPFRVLGIWVAVVLGSLALMSLLPKTYEVQTTLQVLRPPGLSSAMEADSQTKQAALSVLRRDNLVAMLQQTDFIKTWPLHRAPVLKLKDFLMSVLLKPPTEAEKLDGFVGLLEKQLWVTPGEGTVTIGIQLSDPELALLLVESALQNFLEARHTAEISSIGEVISILETRTTQAHEELDETLKRLQALRTARAARLGRFARADTAPAVATLPDPETEQLLVQLKSKKLALADLEDFHRRHVSELEERLQELKTKYSDTHPQVLDAEQALEAARPESVQVAALRQEVQPLEAELKQRGFDAAAALKNGPNREMALQQTLEALDAHEDEDPAIDFAKSQVRHALGHYNDMLDRTAAARLEQDRAGAAFKYRYVVLWPAQKPLGPYRPKPLAVLAASLLAGLLLGVLGVTLVDVTSQKLLEPWQVEHDVGLPTLATLSVAELAQARDGPGTAEAQADALLPSAQVTELWRALRVRPWTTLAVVCPDDGARAWRLVQLLLAAAGPTQKTVLKGVNFLDLTAARAPSVTQALAAGNFAESGERMRFLVACADPQQSPVALSVLGVVDAALLVLELGRSQLPEASATATLAGRERLLGVVLTKG